MVRLQLMECFKDQCLLGICDGSFDVRTKEKQTLLADTAWAQNLERCLFIIPHDTNRMCDPAV